MFTGPDPLLHSLILQLLSVAGLCYAAGLACLTLAAVSPSAVAHRWQLLVGVIGPAATMVGLASAGLFMETIDLRPGHESDALVAWPRLLPSIAVIALAAGFLAGLLRAARPARTALAVAWPIAVVTTFVALVPASLLALAWLAEPDEAAREVRAQSVAISRFFTYLLLFPLATFTLAGVGARVGRVLHRRLGIATLASGGRMEEPGDASVPDTIRAPRHSPMIAWGRERQPRRRAEPWVRILLIAFGTVMLLNYGCNALTPRARLLSSEPAAGVALHAVPAFIMLTFSEALSTDSSMRVQRTVTLLGGGTQHATGGIPVTEATGAPALSADHRTLRARLPEDLPGGLYAVSWTAVCARSRAERSGELYFGVGMAVPAHIVRDGVLDERDVAEDDRREMLLGAMVLLAVGIGMPGLRKLAEHWPHRSAD